MGLFFEDEERPLPDDMDAFTPLEKVGLVALAVLVVGGYVVATSPTARTAVGGAIAGGGAAAGAKIIRDNWRR
jgi:hypothetical protein